MKWRRKARKICETQRELSGSECSTKRVGGIQEGEGGMIKNEVVVGGGVGGTVGSPHPLLSPLVIPLPFSWQTLFGHVTAAREREITGKGWTNSPPPLSLSLGVR